MTVKYVKKGDRVWTPEYVAEDLVRHFNPEGLVLEEILLWVWKHFLNFYQKGQTFAK